MSGVKRSDVFASISSYNRSCENEITQLSRFVTKEYPSLKQTIIRIDRTLVERYFPGELQRIEKLKHSYLKQYEQKVSGIRQLTKTLSKAAEEPKDILQQLQRLKSQIEKSARYHGLDSEFSQATRMGERLALWKKNIRETQQKILELQSTGVTLDDIPALYRSCDEQLLALDRQANEQQQLEKLHRQLTELKRDIHNNLRLFDTEFACRYLPEENQEALTIQAQLEGDNHSIESLNLLVRNSVALVSKVQQTRQEFEHRAKLQKEAFEKVSQTFLNAMVFDPLTDDVVSLHDFYLQHYPKKLEEIEDLQSKLNHFSGVVGNYEFDANQQSLRELGIEIDKIAAISRDDSVHVGEIIETALCIREKMLESRVAGEDQINITTDHILVKGLRIETIIPHGAYFQIAADGSLESDIDAISGNCIKGMEDIAEALSRQGIMLHPDNYRLSTEDLQQNESQDKKCVSEKKI